jgi:hypothetical protein
MIVFFGKEDVMISRRVFLGCLAATHLLARSGASAFAASTRIIVNKDPNCGCCGAWVDHLRANGFDVSVIDTAELNRVKARLGVPNALASCHTAETEGFVIEGHVPAGSIRKLLSQRPKIRGLAVPGMPVGSPGMEVEGTPPDIYDVIAFGPSGQRVFARYEGARELPAS